jgi:hypothetical protein
MILYTTAHIIAHQTLHTNKQQTVIGEHTILGQQRPEAVLTSYIVPPARTNTAATAATDTTANAADIAAAVAAAVNNNSDDSDAIDYGIPQFEDILASPYVENRHPEVVVTSEPNCRQKAVENSGFLGVTLPLEPLPLTPTMPWLNGRPTAGEQSGEQSEEPSAGGSDDDDEFVAGMLVPYTHTNVVYTYMHIYMRI